jgi:transketolase
MCELAIAAAREKLDGRSLQLRRTIIKMLESAGRGHVGATFSLIEIFRVLYDDILRINPTDPLNIERDRCILSKGHGCLALYVMLADKGFFPTEELWKFCKADGILGGHPERSKVPGVEASTGALGHGLPIGVGFALNAKFEGSDYRTYVVTGDGEINEGSVWEAAMSAAKHKLDNLAVLVDYNKFQSYAATCDVLELEPLADKWKSFGFGVAEVNGHSVEDLRKTLAALPVAPGKPSAVICHTVKGKGIKLTENNLEWHHKSRISKEEIERLLKDLDEYNG